MSLATSTKLAIASLVCTYLVRLVGTFIPTAFRNEQIAVGATGLHLVCGVAILLFFVQFLTKYVQRSRGALRGATYWAIVGAALSPLLAFRTLLRIVDPYSLPRIVQAPTIEAVLPPIGTVFILVFFTKLRELLLPEERRTLQRSATAASFGFATLFVLQTIVLLNFLLTDSLRSFSSYSKLVALALLPVITAAVGAIFSFFVSFHRHLTRA